MLLCAAAWGQDARLAGGNVLASETYSFRELLLAGKLDVMDAPALYKKLGIPGISYNERYFKSRDMAYIDQLKAATRKAGRVVVALQVDGNLAVADEARRKEAVQHNLESLRIAHRLGAPVVRINTGGTSREEGADATVGYERVLAAFQEMLPAARKLKLKLAIENHGGVSGSADNIVKIIRATDPKWVGALIDFGNFPEAIRYEEIARLAPHAFGTHVKVGVLNEQGLPRDYDLPRVLKILKDVRYKGSLSIEYVGKTEPVEGVRQSREIIQKLW